MTMGGDTLYCHSPIHLHFDDWHIKSSPRLVTNFFDARSSQDRSTCLNIINRLNVPGLVPENDIGSNATNIAIICRDFSRKTLFHLDAGNSLYRGEDDMTYTSTRGASRPRADRNLE